MSTTTLGRLGERFAAEHLERLGMVVLARNYRTRLGELDLVAQHGDTLVFCEVKACRTGGRVAPWANLHERKQSQVRRMASIWLRGAGAGRPYFATLRFDAIGVLVDGEGELVRLDHLEAAW